MPTPPPTKQIPVSQKYAVMPQQRVVVFTGRDQFALVDTEIAVPFALLKLLAGQMQSAEGQMEMAKAGLTLNNQAPPLVQG